MKKILNILQISDDTPIRTWAAHLMSDRKEEAIESLRREGVVSETVFIFEWDGKKFLAGFSEGEMKPADLDMEVNQEHRAVLKSIIQKKTSAEILYNLEIKEGKFGFFKPQNEKK